MDDDFRRAFRSISNSDSRERSRPHAVSGLIEVARSRKRLAASAVVAFLALAALAATIFATGPRSAETARQGRSDTAGPDADLAPAHRDEEGVEPSARPELEDLGGGRYRGPNGAVVKVPPGWEIAKGDRIELWATLVPTGSSRPIPRIGIGEIAAEGLAPQDAVETVSYYLSEVLPELTSTEEPFRGGVLVKGKGTVEGTQLEEVRWMHPLGDGVLVVWGLFPPKYPGAVELVVDSVEPPQPRE